MEESGSDRSCMEWVWEQGSGMREVAARVGGQESGEWVEGEDVLVV